MIEKWHTDSIYPIVTPEYIHNNILIDDTLSPIFRPSLLPHTQYPQGNYCFRAVVFIKPSFRFDVSWMVTSLSRSPCPLDGRTHAFYPTGLQRQILHDSEVCCSHDDIILPIMSLTSILRFFSGPSRRSFSTGRGMCNLVFYGEKCAPDRCAPLKNMFYDCYCTKSKMLWRSP